MALEEYFKLAFEEKLSVKMPERETDHLTAASKVLEKRREMNEVEAQLNSQKEEFEMKVESLQQRKDDLDSKELKLKESLEKFDKFLKENDLKRIKANKKAQEEHELSLQKEKDIKKLTQSIQTQHEQKDKLFRRLDRDRLYQNFLDSIVNSGDDFDDVADVIKRWSTLSDAKRELVTSAVACQKQLDDLKRDFKTYTHEKNNQIVGYNNTLSGLQSKLDSAVADTMNLESQWNHIKNTAAKKTLMLGKIKVGINNLHSLVVKNSRLPTTLPGVDEDDDLGDEVTVSTHSTMSPEEQLDKVRQYFVNLNEIVMESKRRGQKSLVVSAPPDSEESPEPKYRSQRQSRRE